MRIGIIGLGLMGGSLAQAIKKVHAQNSYIIGYDTQIDSLKTAYEAGAIDNMATDRTSSFSNCNVIFICTPVSSIYEIVKELLPYVATDCILTDIGSTKYEIVTQVHSLLKNSTKRAYFVGGHPMTGSEQCGYRAAHSYLFENAYYLLTPMSDTPDFILFILQKMIERIGAIPLILSASYHDFATATVSHLPHIIASSLVHLVRENDGENCHLHALAAGGFKDITRIASSNPAIWSSICLSNKNQLLKVFERYQDILDRFLTYLKTDDEAELYHFFDASRIYRNTFKEGDAHSSSKIYALQVDAKDEPGIIASIATLLSEHQINIKNIGIVNDREFEAGVLKIVVENKASLLKATEILSKHHYTIYY